MTTGGAICRCCKNVSCRYTRPKCYYDYKTRVESSDSGYSCSEKNRHSTIYDSEMF